MTSRGLGRFYPVASPLHALDPRAKILATTVLVLGLFLVDSIAGFLVVATAVTVLVAASGIPAGTFLRILRPVAFIVALTVLFQVLFSQEGATLVEWGPLEVHSGGLRLGLFLGLRILLLVSAAGLLTAKAESNRNRSETRRRPMKLSNNPARKSCVCGLRRLITRKTCVVPAKSYNA